MFLMLGLNAICYKAYLVLDLSSDEEQIKSLKKSWLLNQKSFYVGIFQIGTLNIILCHNKMSPLLDTQSSDSWNTHISRSKFQDNNVKLQLLIFISVSLLILIINTFNRNIKSTVMEMALIEILCSYNVNKTHILRSKFQDNKSNIIISR